MAIQVANYRERLSSFAEASAKGRSNDSCMDTHGHRPGGERSGFRKPSRRHRVQKSVRHCGIAATRPSVTRTVNTHTRRARYSFVISWCWKARLAEGVGFEPTVEFPPRRFSRPVP